jgi:DNA-binding LacI/PurR family transcriptional regulator
VVPELTNPFFAGLVDGLEGEARAAGKRLLVAASGGDPEEEAREVAALVAWRPAGVVVVPCDDRFAARALLERDRVPFVIVDRPLSEGAPVDTVAVDNRAAAREATRHLLEAGHRDLLVVASSLALGNMRERQAGIGDAVAGCEAAVEVIEVGFAPDAIATAVTRALRRTPHATVAFALNNVLTLGTLRAAQSTGRSIPEDLSLVGFDDYDWMEVFRPPLTAVRQPVAELAAAAWRCLAGSMPPPAAGPTPVLHQPRHVRLPCRLVWRGSVVRPSSGVDNGTLPAARDPAVNPGSAEQ